MYRSILFIFLFLLIGCDKKTEEQGNITYLPNQDISFNDSLVYYQQTPFTGTVVGYNIDNNPECPDEITVDFVDGLIQGRAQAITLEDIDVSYRIEDSKLNGWSTIFVYRVLYNNDKEMDCKAADEVVSGIKYDATQVCDNILNNDENSVLNADKTTGKSVTNTFYSLLQNINQRNFTHKDLDRNCDEVYEYGRQFFTNNQ